MLYKTKNVYKNTRKKKIFALVAMPFVIIGLLAVLELSGITDIYRRPLSDSQKAANERAQQDNVEGQIDSQNHNNDNQAPANTPAQTGDVASQSSQTLRSVTPVLTQYGNYEGNIEASGYVNGVIEDGGACSFTFTGSNGGTLTRTSQGAGDAANTSCATVSIPRSEFTSTGKWTVTLTYKSTSSTGKSSTGSLNVN